MTAFDRRTFLAGSALLAGAALSPQATARAPSAATQGSGVYRYNLGSYQLTALYDGVWYVPIDEKFVRNASSARHSTPSFGSPLNGSSAHAITWPVPVAVS